jgi:hypothetical protein
LYNNNAVENEIPKPQRSTQLGSKVRDTSCGCQFASKSLQIVPA